MSSPKHPPAIKNLLINAQKEGINAQVISPDSIDLKITQAKPSQIRVDGNWQNFPDFVLTRMGGLIDYSSLHTVRLLEKLGIPTMNSFHAINIVRDKLYTQQFLAEYDIPVLKTMLIKQPIDFDYIEHEFGFPIIVKTVNSLHADGVYLCENRENFFNFLQFYRSAHANIPIIVQEFIANSKGRDIRAFVLGDQVITSMYRIGKPDSFKSNFSHGGKVELYDLPPEIKELSLKIANLLDLEYGAVDFLFDTDGFKLCEVNATPGFKGLEAANLDLNLAKEIYQYIKRKLKK